MPTRVLIVIGRPRVGKSTLRHRFESLLHVLGGSCSDAILPVASRTLGKSEEHILSRKEAYRPLLAALGDALVLDDPSYLARTVYHRGQPGMTMPGTFILDGVRRQHELQEFRDYLDRIGVAHRTVWLSRPGAVEVADNTAVFPTDAEVILHSSEDRGELVDAAGLLEALFARATYRTGHYSTSALFSTFAAAA